MSSVQNYTATLEGLTRTLEEQIRDAAGLTSADRYQAQTGVATLNDSLNGERIAPALSERVSSQLRTMSTSASSFLASAVSEYLDHAVSGQSREVEAWPSSIPQLFSSVLDFMSCWRLIDEPMFKTGQWCSPAVVNALAVSASKAYADVGVEDEGGKVDCYVPDSLQPLLEKLGVRRWVEESTGLTVAEGKWNLEYAVYAKPGAQVKPHLDFSAYGDLVLLVGLEREYPSDQSTVPSKTYFASRDGLQSLLIEPGDTLLFDGSCTPHFRAPLVTGEKVVLLIVGFNLAANPVRVLHA